MKVEIPFTNFMRARILAGKKFATSRNKRKGEEGDWFVIEGKKFILINVFKMKLCEIAKLYHRVEGFDTEEEFIAYWKDLHRRSGFEREKFVWFHRFGEKN